MAIKLQFDLSHNVIAPTLVLSKRNGEKIGKLPIQHIVVADELNSYSNFTCKVNKINNGNVYPYWDEIRDFRCVYSPTWDLWFEMRVSVSETNSIEKEIECRALSESELSQIMLYDIEINTEDDIARDDYVVTVLYNETDANGSLLNRILEKAPHYSIGHVDSTIANLQRVFTFDGTSIYDAFQEISQELNCIFILDSSSDSDGNPKREINVYDLESNCLDCGHREEFDGACPNCGSTNVTRGYGEDTTVFVSAENLAEEINFKTDVDSVKNCFKLEAGDDLMTATIINCNPNGSAYIWYISDKLKEDMSDELVERIDAYNTLYDYYHDEYSFAFDETTLNAYNVTAQKYQEYDDSIETITTPIVGYSSLMNAYYNTVDLNLFLTSGLMPDVTMSDTSAALECAKISGALLSPVAVKSLDTVSTATASSAVLAMAKITVDSRYKVTVKTSSLSGTTWSGTFEVTNYSDSEDTAISAEAVVNITDDYADFVEQSLRKKLKSKVDSDDFDIIGLFEMEDEDFVAEIKKYCLNRLNSFHDSCQAVLDILIEYSCGDSNKWSGQSPDLYTEMYVPYYNKLNYLELEIATRESEIQIIVGSKNEDGDYIVKGFQNTIEEEKEYIQGLLDFEAYLGENLWKEFVSNRREDVYSNNNFVSDGLDNSQLFAVANEFIETARKDIYKSAVLQHSITANMHNLLAIKEFEPLLDYFEVGNWIRVKVDDNIYKLRLIRYEVDFDDLANLNVEFSDVKETANGLSDAESIMRQAQSMASSYGSVKRQATAGKKSKTQLDNWVSNGLALTNMKIVNNAQNQDVIWDDNGILCREYLPITDTYDDKQLKIINRGLYLTDDKWLTSKAGIGDFEFYNPMTGETEEAYGVIAETLVGNLILGANIGVYNKTGGLVLDKNGLIITTDATEDATNLMSFTIQRKILDENEDETLQQVAYLDSDGYFVLTGNVKIESTTDENVTSIDDICSPIRYTTMIETALETERETTATTIKDSCDAVNEEVTANLEDYKASIGQYMTFNENGLSLGATTSTFKTVIDNEGVWFKNDDINVAWVNHNQLYIPNAVIENTLKLGNFFFSPRTNGSVALVWQDDES